MWANLNVRQGLGIVAVIRIVSVVVQEVLLSEIWSKPLPQLEQRIAKARESKFVRVHGSVGAILLWGIIIPQF